MSFLVSRRLLLNFRLFPTRTEASREPVDLADVSDETEECRGGATCLLFTLRGTVMSISDNESKRSTVRVGVGAFVFRLFKSHSTPLSKTFVEMSVQKIC